MHDMLFAVAMIIGGARLDLPPAELQQRFAQECVDGKWAADCPALRSELEVDLLGDLRTLALARAPIDREVLLVAAGAMFAPLAEFGLRRLEKIESAAERDIVAAAIDHPSPVIRTHARRLLEQYRDPWTQAAIRWWGGSGASGWDGLIPDQAPELARLGLGSADKLQYRYFASRRGRAVLTSRLPPEGVLALIGRGRKSFTGAEIAALPDQQKAVEDSMRDVERQMREAMAKGDFKKLEEISNAIARQTQVFSSEAAMLQLETEFADDPATRYLRLDNGKGRPIQAAIGRDAALGATVLVIRY
jgi:hypothetical protein